MGNCDGQLRRSTSEHEDPIYQKGRPYQPRSVGELQRQEGLVLPRSAIQQLVDDRAFGRRLCGHAGPRAAFFDHVAEMARGGPAKVGNVSSTIWKLAGREWLNRPVNLERRADRKNFECVAEVYDYRNLPEHALIVDFANEHVGGGCFGAGFVQEEQMVLQSTDFATRLHKQREHIDRCGAVTYEGVHLDAWWPRHVAAKRDELSLAEMVPLKAAESRPLTILAVDAPYMKNRGAYTADTLKMLARKVMLIFEVSQDMDSPVILTGLLGGGAFRNNRPLVLLLHLLFQKPDVHRPVIFHNPLFWSNCGAFTEDLEEYILTLADRWVEILRARGVQTIEQALHVLLDARLPLSDGDRDLDGSFLKQFERARP